LTPVLEGLRDPRALAPGLYGIHRCQDCGAEQTLPRPEPAEMRRLAKQRPSKSAVGASNISAWGRFRGRPRRLWLRLDGDVHFYLRRGRGRLLAVGCDDSESLAQYRDNGFNAEGWSDDPRAAAQARAAGFTVHGGDMTVADDLSRFEPGVAYDVIVLADHALPRSRDPRAMLRALSRHLAPDGELWISLPNRDSLFRDMFGGHWFNWHVPFHALHYGPALLRSLLAENGFLIREQVCVTPTLWLTRSILVLLYSRPDKPTDRLDKPTLLAGWMLVLRGFFFPTLFFLNRALRGDCLMVRARRRAG
jgi:SAM-dependent methyltransferase